MAVLHARLDDRRNADSNRIGWNIAKHDRVRTDHDVIADFYWTEQFCARTNIDIVADHRGKFLIDSAKANGYSVANPAVVAKCCISAYDDATEMIDCEIAANCCFTWQFDTGDDLNKFVKQLIEKGETLA